MRIVVPFFTSKNITSDLSSDLWSQFDRSFDDWMTASSAAYDERSFFPATEIAETEQHYLLSVDLPGMKKEDLKIDLVKNALTISGERKREETKKEIKFQKVEKAYRAFKRSFVLPESVDTEKIDARYENGVLEILIPKMPVAQPRKIEIHNGKKSLSERLLGSAKETSPS